MNILKICIIDTNALVIVVFEFVMIMSSHDCWLYLQRGIAILHYCKLLL